MIVAKTLQGYKEAEKIDKQLENLLKQFPVTEHNYMEWLKLTRTVETTCTLIQGDIHYRRKMQESKGGAF